MLIDNVVAGRFLVMPKASNIEKFRQLPLVADDRFWAGMAGEKVVDNPVYNNTTTRPSKTLAVVVHLVGKSRAEAALHAGRDIGSRIFENA
jgi:hypothetical protein